ncbi:MAG: hypothetical protein LUI13_13510 [Lachnospiraceae bacterium]|nr:hypothetical protein [Lachnospiraceae bacterium]
MKDARKIRQGAFLLRGSLTLDSSIHVEVGDIVAFYDGSIDDDEESILSWIRHLPAEAAETITGMPQHENRSCAKRKDSLTRRM